MLYSRGINLYVSAKNDWPLSGLITGIQRGYILQLDFKFGISTPTKLK
jgi:hypothetical protein